MSVEAYLDVPIDVTLNDSYSQKIEARVSVKVYKIVCGNCGESIDPESIDVDGDNDLIVYAEAHECISD